MPRPRKTGQEMPSARQHGRTKRGQCEICQKHDVIVGASYALKGAAGCYTCILASARDLGWV